MFSYYSQNGTIIRALKIHKRLPVHFFMKWKYFTWYKCGTRICELVRSGYLKRSEIDEIGEKGQRFATYSLTAKWFNLSIPEPTFIEKVKNLFNLYNMKYKLLKDLPLAKAGTEVKFWLSQEAYQQEEIQDMYSNVIAFISKKDIPEWLEEVK